MLHALWYRFKTGLLTIRKMSAMGHKRTSTHLFDHLVSAEQDGLGHFEAERFGGLAIEDELEF